MEVLRSAELQPWFLRLQRRTCPWTEQSAAAAAAAAADDDDDNTQ